MNLSIVAEPSSGLASELNAFRALCEEALALVSHENQALLNQHDYKPGEFNQGRKRLLPELESALIRLRRHRQNYRQTVHSDEIKTVFQMIQSLLMKVLLLDRENQQALLRHGLVPAKHLPSVAVQRPHYVAGLYRQHSPVRDA